MRLNPLPSRYEEAKLSMTCVSETSCASDDALIAELMEHPSESMALEELAQRMRPIIMTEALKYRSTLPYDSDDYMQEGRILLWQIALQKTYRRGYFKRYFTSAIRFRFSNLFRDYVLKNLVRVGEYQDFYGITYQILVVSEICFSTSLMFAPTVLTQLVWIASPTQRCSSPCIVGTVNSSYSVRL